MTKANCEEFVKWSNDMTAAKKNLPRAILGAMKEGMAIVRMTSRARYLTGPRPSRLGMRSGDLARSLKISAKIKGNIIEGSLGTDVFYGKFWEDGFQRKGNFYPKRPFVKPAIKDNENKLTTLFEKAGIRVLQ